MARASVLVGEAAAAALSGHLLALTVEQHGI